MSEEGIERHLTPVFSGIDLLKAEIADMVIVTATDRKDTDGLLKQIGAAKKTLTLLKKEFIDPHEVLLKKQKAKLKVPMDALKALESTVKDANEVYDVKQLEKYRAEQEQLDKERKAEEEKRQAAVMAEMKQRQKDGEKKLVTREMAEQLQPLPKELVGIEATRRTAGGTSSVSAARKWRIKRSSPNGWVDWDKKSRLPIADIGIKTKDGKIISIGQIPWEQHFMVIDSRSINEAFGNGDAVLDWIETYAGTREMVRT